MDIYPCNCNWDIPGIHKLPNHHHFQVFIHETQELIVDGGISIWVDWKDFARQLSRDIPKQKAIILYADNTAVETRHNDTI